MNDERTTASGGLPFDFVSMVRETAIEASKAEGYDVLAKTLAETRKELDGVCGELAEVKDKLAKSREELDRVFVELAAGMAERDEVVAALKLAYYELNAIHARCGVPWWPSGQEHFTSVVETCREALRKAGCL